MGSKGLYKFGWPHGGVDAVRPDVAVVAQHDQVERQVVDTKCPFTTDERHDMVDFQAISALPTLLTAVFATLASSPPSPAGRICPIKMVMVEAEAG